MEADPYEPATLILPIKEQIILRPNLDEDGRGPDPDTITLVFAADQIEVLTVAEGHEVFLGRDHVSNKVQPEIDLTEYGGSSKGVSRLHASLRHDANGWWLTDLDSTNGSWLNRERLAPKDPRPLLQVNQVRLARLDLQIILSMSKF
jgi:pSer/pThr/pTyr-binding forkhead associated (FHA) protein